MKLTEEVKQKVLSLKSVFGGNGVIIYQKDADALFAIIDDWLSAVPETEALTDEQMRLMAHEVIDFNGGITDGVINMLQRHFSRRPAPAPEPQNEALQKLCESLYGWRTGSMDSGRDYRPLAGALDRRIK